MPYSVAVYAPQPVRTPAGSVATLLATHARSQTLTIYAGAGVSAASPTSLPGASSLALRIVGALSSQVDLTTLDDEDQCDLIKVADAISELPMGRQLLRRTILEVADLAGATTNFAHEVLAVLLCEGAAVILETNYDDCIERAAQPERPDVVRTAAELLQATGPALLKAHGCVTQPDTMLITAAELAGAPAWATAQVAARLRQHPVVFLGIGSVADYVRNTVKEIYDEVGTSHVLVVDPALANWDTRELAWKELLPNLATEQRDERTAEEFCDALIRAYAAHYFLSTNQAVDGMDIQHPQRTGVQTFLTGFESRDGVWVVRWLREASFRLATGKAVIGSPESIQGALAISALVGKEASTRFGREGVVRIQPAEGAEAQLMLLLAFGTTLGSAASVEARRRVARARGQDLLNSDNDVIVVLIGHTGPLDEELPVEPGNRIADLLAAAADTPQALPNDVIATAQSDHIINGVTAGMIWLVDGGRLIEAA